MRTLKISFLVFILTVSTSAQNFWQEVFTGNFTNRFALEVSSNGNVYLVSDSFLVRSTDNGLSWQNIYTATAGLRSFGASPTGTIFFNPDFLIKSTDEGNTWQNVYCCFTPWFIIPNEEGDIFIETGLLIGGGSYRSTNEGTTWTQIGIQPYYLFDIVFKGGLTFASFFDGIGGQLFKSTNKGDSWELISSAPTNLDILFVTKNGKLYGGRSSSQPDFLFRSTDDGETWSTLGQGIITNPLADIIENQIGDLYVASQGLGVFKSTDDGNSWQTINSGLTSLSVSKFVIDSLGYLYLSNYSEKLYRSVEPTIPVELISFLAQVLEAKVELNWSTAIETNNTGFEILRFAQNDNEWNKIGFVPGHGTTTETQHYSFTDTDIKPGKHQYKLKQIDYDGTFEYSQIVEVEIPFVNEFSLSQNYPNPFNPVTKIKYTIPASLNPSKGGTFVQLTVYDILGRVVEILVNEEKRPGVYEVDFDGSDLSSGVYLYKLTAGEFSDTKKLVLLK